MLNSLEKQWYVIYTLSKHEKKIDQLLSRARIESFLPLHTEVRQWSDRKKKVLLPLFPNYLFVHISPKDFWKVLSLNGVIRFVSNGSAPGTISNSIIQSIRRIVSGKVEVRNTEMREGEKVRATSGPFMGAEGNFVRYGRKNMLIINIELLHRSVMLEINPYHVERI